MIEQTLFISDLHLGQGSPRTNRLFCDFLTNRAAGVRNLYILGDLFDAWIGDDDNTRFARRIRKALRETTRSGTRVYFQQGNRDFLLGDRFCRETGIELLDDYAIIDLYGELTLITHGDLLCTDDLPYQEFRARSRSPEWKKNVLTKPLIVRLLAARWYRIRSYLHKRKKTAAIMDVNRQFVIETFQKHHVRRIIHGHTHRPALHQYQIEQSRCGNSPDSTTGFNDTQANLPRASSPAEIVQAERFVLPAWSDSKGHVLCWNEQGHWSEELE